MPPTADPMAVAADAEYRLAPIWSMNLWLTSMVRGMKGCDASDDVAEAACATTADWMMVVAGASKIAFSIPDVKP